MKLLRLLPNNSVVNGSRLRLLLPFWRFVRPQRWRLSVLGLLFVLNQATTIVIPIAIGRVLDQVIPGGDQSGLNAIVIALCAFLALKCILIFLERELSALTGSLIVRNVRAKLHAHFLRMSLRFLDEYQVGRVVSRVMGDTECVKNLLFSGINSLASAARFIFVLSTLLVLDWKLALVSCAILPIFLAIFWRYTDGVKPAYSELNDAGAQLYADANETFSGVRVVKTYCGQRRANSRFVSRTHDMLRRSLAVSRSQHLVTVIWEGSAWLSLIVLLWYGGYQVLAGTLTVGQLVTFYGLLGQLQGPVADLIGFNAALQPALVSVEKIEEVFRTQPEIADDASALSAAPLRGEIEFQDVSFTYKNGPDLHAGGDSSERSAGSKTTRRTHTLENISFRVHPGQCVAVIGASGSGKSTLLNLLARLYDVDSGAIKVDGIDIRQYRLRSYLSNFAIVLQDTFLFRGTIRDNIRYARWEASEAEIVHAAKLGGAWEFIAQLDQGLDTPCAERGVSLSGGQKQRIALARAILADPRILMLDEATSALDSHTEAQVQAAIERIMQGRTTFVVAHRLSTITSADLIIVLDAGRIVEMGSHADLLRAAGRYCQMLREQYGRVQENLRRADGHARVRDSSRRERDNGFSSRRMAVTQSS
ncbi:MAG TPA: ABC transporter ATP-binding protein [Planctomycetota bacterium]|jgi:ABC-type multidrug transport system fused ATPase/permease subunit